MRAALLDWAARDQALRLGPVEPEVWARFDAQATTFLKQVVAAHGWPGRALVGSDGAQAAWLLAQHSPDLAFQQAALGAMSAAPPGEVDPAHVAYLLDRVRVRRGQGQLYGTQVGPDGRPFSIEDAAGVDARRRAAGLEPLEEYLAAFARPEGPG